MQDSDMQGTKFKEDGTETIAPDSAEPVEAIRRPGTRAGLLLAGSVTLLALPSAVLAFATSLSGMPGSLQVPEGTSSQADSRSLAREMALRSLATNQRFPFTPAGTPNRPERSVNVAVRVDPEAANAIIVRGRLPMATAPDEPGVAPGRMRIAPTAFNLGVSRGYQTFSQQDLTPAPAPRDLADLPEIKKFSLPPGTSKPDLSRFSTRLSIDDKRAPGHSPRSYAGDSGEVDLSGAYRVAKNLDVTAGVRYSQDRDRLLPLTDGKQDSQAVYVGTQFKF